jgi:hypothetical protein
MLEMLAQHSSVHNVIFRNVTLCCKLVESNLKDGGTTYLQNIGTHQPDYNTILKMEAVCSSETLGHLYHAAKCHNPEDHVTKQPLLMQKH